MKYCCAIWNHSLNDEISASQMWNKINPLIRRSVFHSVSYFICRQAYFTNPVRDLFHWKRLFCFQKSLFHGADGGTWTLTSLRTLAPEASASAIPPHLHIWCDWPDLNRHGCPHAPQTCASAYSATVACWVVWANRGEKPNLHSILLPHLSATNYIIIERPQNVNCFFAFFQGFLSRQKF